MSVYLKEKKYLIISLIIIMLDGIITYYIPSYFNNLNYFYPMLTISLIPFLYKGNSKYFYQYIFFIGIIYDLLYSNIFLFNSLIFLVLSKIDTKLFKIFKENLFIYLIIVILNILLYDGIIFLLIYLTNYQVVTIIDYIYKIEHSIILNIIFGIIYYLIFSRNNNILCKESV